MDKTKKNFTVSMLYIDGNGYFQLQINDKIYKGKLPSGYIWWNRLQYMKNKGKLIQEIKKYTKLEKTDLIINTEVKNGENYKLF